MNQTIRTLVLLFLQGLPDSKHEQFNQGYELYKKSDGKNLATERNLNRIGYTDTGLDNLLYDLQKMHGITDTEIANPVEVVQSNEDFLAEMNVVGVEEVSGVLAPEFNTDTNEISISTVDGSKPLREEFPFLNATDCPEVFYIVVGKKISTYKAWQEAQQKLVAIDAKEVEATEEEVKELAATAEASFRENQELYAELNYYAEHGEILGKHPLFRESVAKREVEAMSLEQLSKFRNSSAKFFSVQKKKLIDFKDNADKLAEINSNIEDRKYKLALVNAKLGIADAGK